LTSLPLMTSREGISPSPMTNNGSVAS